MPDIELYTEMWPKEIFYAQNIYSGAQYESGHSSISELITNI